MSEIQEITPAAMKGTIGFHDLSELERERIRRKESDKIKKLLLTEIAVELGFNEKYIIRYRWGTAELKRQVIGAIRERAIRIDQLTLENARLRSINETVSQPALFGSTEGG